MGVLVLLYPLPQKVRIDPMFERKSRYRHAWLKAGRDQTIFRYRVISASPIATYKPYPQFLIIFFHDLVSTFF